MTMKKGIHPEVFVVKAKCACGYSFNTRSTLKEINMDICSRCHPLYTGDQKFVDTAGRIEKFKARYGDKASLSNSDKNKK